MVFKPASRKARVSSAVTKVFPTSVSVPVIKKFMDWENEVSGIAGLT